MLIRISIIFLALAGFFIVSFATPSRVKASDNCTSFSGNGINNWYPFVYRKDDGQLTGIVVDGTHEALKRIGLKLNIVNDKPWKRILYDMEQGNVDMVLGAYWNKERAAQYLYSEQLGTDELRVFVKDGNQFSLTSPQDLIGRSGMRLLGGSLGDEFDNFANRHLDFIEVPKSDSIVIMLQNNRADYGILGYVEGLQHTHALDLEETVVPLEMPILSNAMHVMINKNANCAHRVDEMNRAIQDMRDDGTLQKIIDDHLSLIKQ
ncbi:substrate-binding periplasmic protein [Kiloniella majae]|uniref:substrate-binding periplasmic protein n=1 Tax=Kiloniella majae TaxID=1938558 RepID=UPI000A276D76|nr:transporter substrate-binding domain-containing protein [Kiloniella majae]